jgi:rare lipoprotein A
MKGRSLIPLIALMLATPLVDAYAPHPTPATPPHPVSSTSDAIVEHGRISYYGPGFAGHRTANGERFNPQAMTMAHRWLPLGTIVEVTNDTNGRRVRLRVNDRGPVPRDRVADVSVAASKRLGFMRAGLTDATIDVVSMPRGETLAAR